MNFLKIIVIFIERFRFKDDYEYEIFSIPIVERVQTMSSVVVAGTSHFII